MDKDRSLEEAYAEYLRNRPAGQEPEKPVMTASSDADGGGDRPGLKKKKKKRRKKHYFLRLLVFIAVVVGIICLMTSSLFDVQKIEVEGNSYFTAEQVIARSGITQGVNIFFSIDKRGAKKGLMEDPYIKNVTVERKLPSTVVILVEERQETAAVPYTDKYIIVDGEGLILRTSEVEPKIPILMGLTIKEMEPGKPLEVEENSVLNDTLGMVSIMQQSEVYFKKIDISKVMVRAYVYDTLICQGMPEDITKALSDGTLETMLYRLYTDNIEHGTITITSDTTNMAFSPIYE
ncbi:MAG: FtsQ-type POTRA domain-containing protein [Firmicutes bacterium]|nr:FtsQ-type POTRA domain-containing protein [Bacillota bacterium]